MFIFSQNKVLRVNNESCINELELNIIKRIKNGDINAFETIVERYKSKAMALTMNILKNRQEAEDSLQDAFVKTFTAIINDKFEERSKFSTYFYRIVYNTAAGHYRKQKERNFRFDDKPFGQHEDSDISDFEMKIDRGKYVHSGRHTPDGYAMSSDIKKIVSKYLSEIPGKYSIVLTLFFINGLSHEEIAGTLEIPLGTVKNRIFRAKEKLKETILKGFTEKEILELNIN